MRKVLLWVFRITSVILLVPAFIMAIPGGILHILTEEFLDY